MMDWILKLPPNLKQKIVYVDGQAIGYTSIANGGGYWGSNLKGCEKFKTRAQAEKFVKH